VKSNKLFILVVAALLTAPLFVQAGAIAPPAGATPVFSDDFESYANDAAFKAVWNGAANPAPSLDIGYGLGGGNAVLSYGDNVAQRNFAPVGLSDAAPITAEVDYWDFDTSVGRNTLGLRNAGMTTLFEIGEYGTLDPDPDVAGSVCVAGYGFRTLYVGGPVGDAQGWIALTPNRIASTDPAVGYHHFKLVVGSSYATASVRLSNGNVYSKTVALTSTVGDTLDNVRIGGPSGVVSLGGADYDNVQVYTTPEPASMILLAVGGLLLRRRAA
jgi:hypothetical protein